MTRPKLLVTPATTNFSLGVVRALGRAGFDVSGFDLRGLPLGLRSRYAVRNHVCPANDEAGVLAGLLEAVEASGAGAVFPVGTGMTGFVAKHRRHLEGLVGLNLPDYGAFRAAFDNERTLRAGADLGIPSPRLYSLEEARRQIEDNAATVVVKPRFDWGGGSGVSFVGDVASLERSVAECRKRFGELILQEHIPGGSDCMRAVQIVFDRGGRLAAWFTSRKVRWPPAGGRSGVLLSTHEPDLIRLVVPLFESWGWAGPAEVELKADPRDGKTKLIEINPRFGNYLAFPAACGLDLTALAAALALGREGSAPRGHATGVKQVNRLCFARSLASELRESSDRLAVLGKAWKELSGPRGCRPREPADPLPRLGKLLREVSDALGGPGSSRLERPREWLRRGGDEAA